MLPSTLLPDTGNKGDTAAAPIGIYVSQQLLGSSIVSILLPSMWTQCDWEANSWSWGDWKSCFKENKGGQ